MTPQVQANKGSPNSKSNDTGSTCNAAAKMALAMKPPYYAYKNYSEVPDPDPMKPVTVPGRIPNFPAKLFAILARPELSDIISWMPHGRGWKVHKPREFEVKVIPSYFDHAKYSSFIRQANGWGFKRVSTKGVDRNSHYHELFLRGLPHLLKQMKRPNSSGGGSKNMDPDFYKISEEFPLPELSKPSYEESTLYPSSAGIVIPTATPSRTSFASTTFPSATSSMYQVQQTSYVSPTVAQDSKPPPNPLASSTAHVPIAPHQPISHTHAAVPSPLAPPHAAAPLPPPPHAVTSAPMAPALVVVHEDAQVDPLSLFMEDLFPHEKAALQQSFPAPCTPSQPQSVIAEAVVPDQVYKYNSSNVPVAQPLYHSAATAFAQHEQHPGDSVDPASLLEHASFALELDHFDLDPMPPTGSETVGGLGSLELW